MAHKFSPSTGTFYPSFIQYADGAIPADAIDATDAEMKAAHARGPRDGLAVIGGKVTVVPYTGPTLGEAQRQQIAALRAAYAVAIGAPVSFTTGAGKTAQFAQGPQARDDLGMALAAGAAKWTAGLWLDANGAPIVPFSFADIEGLNAAIDAAPVPEHGALLAKIAAVLAATTVPAVQAITF